MNERMNNSNNKKNDDDDDDDDDENRDSLFSLQRLSSVVLK